MFPAFLSVASEDFLMLRLCVHACVVLMGMTPPVPAFVDDPGVLGDWVSVDYVPSMERFVPGHRQWQGELFLKSVAFLPGGAGSGNWRWSKGFTWDVGENNVGTYEFRNVGGKEYLFMEWMSGDVTIRGEKPSYYVLERGAIRARSNRGLSLVATLSNLYCAVLFIAISVPLVFRKIPMNHFYGFRIKKAFMSDELWYDINAYGGRQMIWAAVGMILSCLAGLYYREEFDGAAADLLTSIGPMCLFVTIAIVRTLLHAVKLPPP